MIIYLALPPKDSLLINNLNPLNAFIYAYCSGIIESKLIINSLKNKSYIFVVVRILSTQLLLGDPETCW